MSNLTRKMLLVVLLMPVLTACDLGGGSPTPTAVVTAIATPTAAIEVLPTTSPEGSISTSTPEATPSAAGAETCSPTVSDPPGPYAPNAPVRSSVGKGHIVRGVVRSSLDCAPIANAMLELWPATYDDIHRDDQRATVFTDNSGAYSFESDPPEHIHMRVSAPGYQTIFTNRYHPAKGQAEGTFDIVLVPEVAGGTSVIETPTAETNVATSTVPSASVTAESCAPTKAGEQGPSYKPDAPERDSVGKGHVLTGVVKSDRNCRPVVRAKIEFWQTNPNGEYDDAHRATLFTNSSGAYKFESNFPQLNGSSPPQINLRVSAGGYRTIFLQYYPKEGETEGVFDIVMAPNEP